MNNLDRMQVSPDVGSDVVVPAYDAFQGSDLSADRPWWSSMVFFLALGLSGFFLWASLFEIDQTVRAPGEIAATARNQIVQVVDGGVLAELFIEEGERVQQGQMLAVLEKERAQASFEEGRAKVAALRIALVRASAEARQEPLVFSDVDLVYPAFVAAQRELYRQKRRALEESLALLQKNLDLAQRQLGINEDLYESRDVSLLDVMGSQARVSDAENKVLEAENKYLLDAFEESAKLETELVMAQQQAKEKSDVFSHTEVRAPVAGIVKHLNINTLGGVMRAGDQLMEISPTESELIVEIRISPADVGQLELGLPVGISLDAFDSSIYGKLEGELVYLSSDTLSEKDAQGRTDTYYRGRVRLDQGAKANDPKLAALELRPGMTAGVDVRTGKRTVMHFIAKPILRGFSGALTQK